MVNILLAKSQLDRWPHACSVFRVRRTQSPPKSLCNLHSCHRDYQHRNRNSDIKCQLHAQSLCHVSNLDGDRLNTTLKLTSYFHGFHELSYLVLQFTQTNIQRLLQDKITKLFPLHPLHWASCIRKNWNRIRLNVPTFHILPSPEDIEVIVQFSKQLNT